MTEPVYSGTLTGDEYEIIQEQHIPYLLGEMVDSDVEIFLYDDEVEVHADYPDSGTSRQEVYHEDDLATSLEELEDTLEGLEGETEESSDLVDYLRGIPKYI